MPFSSVGEARASGFPVALQEIELTLEQINRLAEVFDALKADPEVDSPMAIAVTRFKETHEAKDGKWVETDKENSPTQSREPPAQDRRGRNEPLPLCFDARIAETEEGWIVPVVATLQGIHNGFLKPASAITRSASTLEGAWFVPDGHPEGPDGEWMDATEKHASGVVRNPVFDERTLRLRAEVLLWKKDARNRALVERIRKGEPVEVSVGFRATDVPVQGAYNGSLYVGWEEKITYDHVAVVPKGACSWEDGCGLGRNAEEVGEGEGDRGEKMGTDECSEKVTQGVVAWLKENFKLNKETPEAGGTEDKEVEKMNTEKDEIDRLTKENADLREKAGSLEEIAKERDALQEKVNIFEAAEKEKIETVRNAIVEEIVKVNGKEPETYAEWEPEKLEELRDALQAVRANRSGIAGPDGGTDGFPEMGVWNHLKGEWVTGKKVGGITPR